MDAKEARDMVGQAEEELEEELGTTKPEEKKKDSVLTEAASGK